MAKCKYCLEEINPMAKRCKHCGSYQSRTVNTMVKFNLVLGIIISIVTISLTVLIWSYQKKVDYQLNLLDFKREAFRIIEMERDFQYFEAYRAYANLRKLYSNIWVNEDWIRHRFNSLPINKGDHKIVIYCVSSSNDNALKDCILELKNLRKNKYKYKIWIENAIRADDFCCLVSRFKEKSEAMAALEYFRDKINDGCYYVVDPTSENYRLNDEQI